MDKQHVQKSFNIVIYVQAKARLTKTKVETIAYIPMVSIHVLKKCVINFAEVLPSISQNPSIISTKLGSVIFYIPHPVIEVNYSKVHVTAYIQ